jgi:hypothetical protein
MVGGAESFKSVGAKFAANTGNATKTKTIEMSNAFFIGIPFSPDRFVWCRVHSFNTDIMFLEYRLSRRFFACHPLRP